MRKIHIAEKIFSGIYIVNNGEIVEFTTVNRSMYVNCDANYTRNDFKS